MRSTLFFLCTLFLLSPAGTLFAQKSFRPVFDHQLRMSAQQRLNIARPTTAVPETIAILAAMVEFQPDNDSRTTGDGTFDLTGPIRNIVDPPPHDAAYFTHHLTFLHNYYRKASDGLCIVVATLLPDVYRLPKEMKSYSPSRTSAANVELGNLMQDSWRIIDSSRPGIPFDSYDAFILFHAGTGRDIDLVSIYGYDPRPFDIPSLYLNLPSLKKMFGDSYRGVSVNGGANFITNTMIIPETESRDLEGIGGTARLQLGINGLLAASLGSHLGLPDLFNTKDGKSGIGRFGLMDGQSIFSWNGLFPPEPSAWEKYFLGWIEPVTVNEGNTGYALPAVTLNAGPDTIYRIPISEGEYFLVENRNRDARRDGARVTIARPGGIVEFVRQRDTTGFSAFNQDSLYGIVIDVDEFDWSLPGGVSREAEFFDGGILVWHIDETVINARYATGTVNANPDRRGVDLEEADGSQDIGQSYGLLEPGSGSEDGTPLDYWYDGNSSPVRKRLNEFSPVSLPNCLSYGLVNPHITLSRFSPRGPRMSLNIAVGNESIGRLPGFPKWTGRVAGKRALKSFSLTGSVSNALVAAAGEIKPPELRRGGLDDTTRVGGAVFGWNGDGEALDGLRSDGMLIEPLPLPSGTIFTGTPLVYDSRLDTYVDIAVGVTYDNAVPPPTTNTALEGWMLSDGNGDSLADRSFSGQILRSLTCSPAAGDSLIAIGTGGGIVAFTGEISGAVRTVSLGAGDTSAIVGVTFWESGNRFIAVSANGTIALVDESGVIARLSLGRACSNPAVAGVISSSAAYIAVATNGGEVYLLDRDLAVVPGFPVSTASAILNAPALADIDADGRRDIVVFSGNRIVVLNQAGAMVDNFPIALPGSSLITSSPVVADVNGDGSAEIVAVTGEGLIFAFDRTGNTPDGFPLLAGPNSGSTPVVFYKSSACLSCADIAIAVASDDGYVYGWKSGRIVTGPANPPAQPWPQFMYNAQNSGRVVMPLTPSARTTEFLPSSLAYNWPNPVGPADNNITRIRFFLGEDAPVSIRIFDLAGQIVHELQMQGRGGVDNEVVWDASGIESGVYFARINADGNGRNGTAVVKIAIVK